MKERESMNKYIIFGCGEYGKSAYYKLRKYDLIYAYTDNNEKLVGEKLFDIDIISAEEAFSLCKNQNMEIIIAASAYEEIQKQLKRNGICSGILWREGFFYRYDEKNYYYPIKEFECSYYKKTEESKLSILFVQNAACIRTLKIAKALYDNGVNVSFAYTIGTPEIKNEEYASCFEMIKPIFTMQGLIDWINKSDFDIIHSSNEPDILTALLTYSNKPVVHDCHDLSSAYKSMTPDEMAVEYIANVKSAGVIYTTEGIRQQAIKKFGISKTKTYVLEKLISEELKPEKRLPKLSATDGKIHCVYEGGIIGSDKYSHRFFEDIWKKIADARIEIHYYSPSDYQYCKKLETLHPNFHFEGNISSKELAVEMSKYDVGLCLLNINEKNKQYLEYASHNKIQEYANAGIPVAVGNIESQIAYVEGHSVGRFLDVEADILKQLKVISKIEIPKDILKKNKLTLESRIPSLIDFYNRLVNKKHF